MSDDRTRSTPLLYLYLTLSRYTFNPKFPNSIFLLVMKSGATPGTSKLPVILNVPPLYPP